MRINTKGRWILTLSPSATWQITSPVDGSIVGKDFPLTESLNSLLINICRKWNEKFRYYITLYSMLIIRRLNSGRRRCFKQVVLNLYSSRATFISWLLYQSKILPVSDNIAIPLNSIISNDIERVYIIEGSLTGYFNQCFAVSHLVPCNGLMSLSSSWTNAVEKVRSSLWTILKLPDFILGHLSLPSRMPTHAKLNPCKLFFSLRQCWRESRWYLVLKTRRSALSNYTNN